MNRAGTVIVTLPTAEVRPGRTYTIKDESGAAGNNNITVATEGSETIDGSATDTIGTNFGAKTYYSDGSNWFTIPILAAPSLAHSDTTGQGTDYHHNESHTVASHSDTIGTGAELETLTDGSETTLHSHAASGAVTRLGGSTTEATTTSTSFVDGIAIASLSIGATLPLILSAPWRKTTGAAATANIRFTLNSASVDANNSNAANEAQDGSAMAHVPGRATNYIRGGWSTWTGKVSSTGGQTDAPKFGNETIGSLPTAALTDLDLQLKSGSRSMIVGASNYQPTPFQ